MQTIENLYDHENDRECKVYLDEELATTLLSLSSENRTEVINDFALQTMEAYGSGYEGTPEYYQVFGECVSAYNEELRSFKHLLVV